jgi:hypothetical protein
LCTPGLFCVFTNIDSIYTIGSFKKINTNGYLQNASKQAIVLPLTWQQQYNTHHPYGVSDGSMIPAKGYQTQISFGVFFKKGLFSLQVQPELVFAQNANFSTFPSQHSDSIWKNYYSVLNMPPKNLVPAVMRNYFRANQPRGLIIEN